MLFLLVLLAASDEAAATFWRGDDTFCGVSEDDDADEDEDHDEAWPCGLARALWRACWVAESAALSWASLGAWAFQSTVVGVASGQEEKGERKGQWLLQLDARERLGQVGVGTGCSGCCLFFISVSLSLSIYVCV